MVQPRWASPNWLSTWPPGTGILGLLFPMSSNEQLRHRRSAAPAQVRRQQAFRRAVRVQLQHVSIGPSCRQAVHGDRWHERHIRRNEVQDGSPPLSARSLSQPLRCPDRVLRCPRKEPKAITDFCVRSMTTFRGDYWLIGERHRSACTYPNPIISEGVELPFEHAQSATCVSRSERTVFRSRSDRRSVLCTCSRPSGDQCRTSPAGSRTQGPFAGGTWASHGLHRSVLEISAVLSQY